MPPPKENTMIARVTAAAIAIALTLGLAAAPASAQTRQDGLVNLSLTDTTVQVPIGIAANICDVTANVIARSLDLGDSNCDAVARGEAHDQGGNGGPTRQNGLVNVAVTDLTVQVPIGIAANVCDVTVNVLSQMLDVGDTDCNAEGVAVANA
jgi:hypothetical protein